MTDLERFPVGRWIYAGDYPADPDTTPDSPPFVNGSNAGGGLRRLRFRRTNENGLEVAGAITGLTPGDIVVNVASLYRPDESEFGDGWNQETAPAEWRLDPNGDLVFVGVGGTSTSTPSGPAGGVLSGTYPNPGFAVDMATQAELDAHINDATDAHDASAISFVPVGTIAATDVQAAVAEVASESLHYGSNTGSSIVIETTVGNIKLDADGQNVQVDGFNVTFNVDNDLQAFVAALFGVFADAGVDLFSDTTGIEIRPASVTARLDVGATFTILDSAANPIFQMTDGSSDIHIPAGGNVIADL